MNKDTFKKINASVVVPYNESRNNKYSDFGLPPSALSEDINQAASMKQDELNLELTAIKHEVEELLGRIPGLKELQSMVDNNQDYDEKKYIKLKETAKNEVPDLDEKLQQRAKLQKLVDTFHDTNTLANSTDRAKYDNKNEPFSILKIKNGNEYNLGSYDLMDTMMLVRKDVLNFLNQSEGGTYHPADITKSDFISEYSHNEILDDTGKVVHKRKKATPKIKDRMTSKYKPDAKEQIKPQKEESSWEATMRQLDESRKKVKK